MKCVADATRMERSNNTEPDYALPTTPLGFFLRFSYGGQVVGHAGASSGSLRKSS